MGQCAEKNSSFEATEAPGAGATVGQEEVPGAGTTTTKMRSKATSIALKFFLIKLKGKILTKETLTSMK